ncbi:DUF924 family protein [Paracoccus xiamenensis]|uniref:DUF924 family protein n=1 Tax=Paracoccus xiamenensis TaxID=2714901 RepID=UPI001F2BC41C|nr:DUF924 family protein [Paracoccus xiamenensis]
MTPQQINAFWLDEIDEKQWYNGSAELDRTISERFGAAWEQADSLASSWSGTAEGALAALILTDQFPRNMFRDNARSFATDKLARRIATNAIKTGLDMATPEPARQFFYTPFMHSEEMGDQNRAVSMFEERMPGDNVRHAHLHREVIRRFGRFPWRNDALGRETTPQERAFLDAGGYGALVAGRVSLADAG